MKSVALLILLLSTHLPARPNATPSEAHAGEMWYMALRCYECHGTSGKGDGPSAASLRDDKGVPVNPTDFAKAKFKHGNHPEEIFNSILKGVPGTPMAAFDNGALLLDRGHLRFKGTGGKLRYPVVEGLKKLYPAEKLGELKKFIDALPAHDQVAKMNDTEKESMVSLRRWQLVYYIQQLVGK